MADLIPSLDDFVGEGPNWLEKLSKSIKLLNKNLNDELSEPKKKRSDKPLQTYFLPMPDSFQETYNQDFQVSEYDMDNFLISKGYGMIIDGIRGKNGGNMANSIQDIVGLTEHLGRRGNLTINPNTMSIYTGSSPRTFSLSFKMIPTSLAQANELITQLQDIRIQSMGKVTRHTVESKLAITVSFIQSSHVFTFEFYDSEKPDGANNYMNYMVNTGTNTDGFFLTDMHIDIGNQGDGIQFFNDNSTGTFKMIPKYISFELSFQERKPLYRSDWDGILGEADSLISTPTNTTATTADVPPPITQQSPTVTNNPLAKINFPGSIAYGF